MSTDTTKTPKLHITGKNPFSNYFQLIGTDEATGVTICVNVYQDSGQAIYVSLGTPTVTLHLGLADYQKLDSCPIHPETNDEHQVEYDYDAPIVRGVFPVVSYTCPLGTIRCITPKLRTAFISLGKDIQWVIDEQKQNASRLADRVRDRGVSELEHFCGLFHEITRGHDLPKHDG
jgi:hypothetical protein